MSAPSPSFPEPAVRPGLILADAAARARFEEALPTHPCPPDGCLPWTGVVNNCGYGAFWYDGWLTKPHLIALAAAGKQPEAGRERFQNTCGNRSCCNPNHWA